MIATHTREADSAFHAGIVSARFYETWDFYTSVLGFRTLSENDGYVRLAHPDGAQLSVLQHELNGHWAEVVSATEGRGLWLTLTVDDAEAEFQRLLASGADVARAHRGAKWGDAACVVRDPNGVLIFIVPRCAVKGAPGLHETNVG